MQKRLTQEQKDRAIDLYLSGKSLASTGSTIGVSPEGVRKILKSTGVQTRSLKEAGRKYLIKHNAFSKYTEESLYWAGFLHGDGYFYTGNKKSYEINLKLSYKDFDHLEKLKTFLGSDHKITINTDTHFGSAYKKCHLKVKSDQLVKDLFEYGVVEKDNPILPEQVANNHHFWRGCVDSDGSIIDGKVKAINLVGSWNLIQYFFNFCDKHVGLVKATPKLVKNQTNLYCLQINKKSQAKELAQLLYGNASISLDRKKERVRKLFTKVKN